MITKFRGLSAEAFVEDEWKYGYLIEDEGYSFIINQVIEANEQYITIGSWYPVIPETVSQSTGLYDRNDKEIFEGDILGIETIDEIVKVNVFWDDKHALFMFKSEKYNESEALAELVEDNAYPFEVIGNVWEDVE